MISLHIDPASCIRCLKCVRICTSHIFFQKDDETIGTDKLNTCISCGQCLGVCPTDSISHSAFSSTQVHPIEKALLPAPEQVDLLIKSRRSNRAFSSKPLPEDFLNKIVEAAWRAPSASNGQEVSYTIITDPAKLKQVSQLTIDVFDGILKLVKPLKPLLKVAAPEVAGLINEFVEMKQQFSEGNDLILRNAKALILFHTPAGERFGVQDANLSYQNASLMAESLGVAHFYTGFVYAANDLDKAKKRLNRYLGIKETIQAGMALGMPSFRFEKYVDKNPIRVRWM